jgi:hypothetical protein
MLRTVTYPLISDSCWRNSPSLEPPTEVKIGCTFVPNTSGIGSACYFFFAFGFVICATTFVITIVFGKEKIIKKSQPMFVYIFLIGAMLLNLTIVVFVGPNTDAYCMLRPWCFDISSTLMFAPLIMKLHRVDKLFNNPQLKKIVYKNSTLFMQIAGLVLIDVIILIFWSVFERPRGALHIG